MPVQSITLQIGHGIVHDAHAGDWHRQVSLLDVSSIEKIKNKGFAIAYGAFAENITTSGIVLYELPIGTRFLIGDVVLKMTQIGKECHSGCAIRELTGDCVMPREGVFAIVEKEGTIKAGDTIIVKN